MIHFFFSMTRRPPRSTQRRSSAASDVYKRQTGCSILTIGQYLQPTRRHYPVEEYVTPEQFAQYQQTGLEKGFEQVESAPLVRSSYHAEKHIKK